MLLKQTHIPSSKQCHDFGAVCKVLRTQALSTSIPWRNGEPSLGRKTLKSCCFNATFLLIPVQIPEMLPSPRQFCSSTLPPKANALHPQLCRHWTIEAAVSPCTPCSRYGEKHCFNFFRKRRGMGGYWASCWASILTQLWVVAGWVDPSPQHVFTCGCGFVEATPFLGDWQVDVLSVKPARAFSLLLSTSLQQEDKPSPVWSCCWVLVAWLRTWLRARWRVRPMNCHGSAVSCVTSAPVPRTRSNSRLPEQSAA